MGDGPRLSLQSLKVLRVFLAAASGDVRAELAGADIMQAATLSSGTLYPILLRFERVGILTSQWEEVTGRTRAPAPSFLSPDIERRAIRP